MVCDVKFPARSVPRQHLARVATLLAAVPLLLLSTPATSAAAFPAEGLQSLTDVLAERLATADTVAAVKWRTGSPVADPARETQVIAATQRAAIVLGITPERAGTFVRDQIDVGKVIQSIVLARWHADPATAPTAPEEIAPIRERITALTSAAITHLRANASALRAPTCPLDLTHAIIATNTRRHTDTVHAAALAAASRSLCIR